jgi:hypothetical protein
MLAFRSKKQGGEKMCTGYYQFVLAVIALVTGCKGKYKFDQICMTEKVLGEKYEKKTKGKSNNEKKTKKIKGKNGEIPLIASGSPKFDSY